MVQLATKRFALALYGVLLVLPTVVLGGLHWRQLELDHRMQMAAVPGDAADAARRLSDALERRVKDLLERENQRPFYHYKDIYFPPKTIGAELAFVPSPLVTGPRPKGVLAWFTYRNRRSGPDAAEVFSGGPLQDDEAAAVRLDLGPAIRTLSERDSREPWQKRLARATNVRTDTLGLPVAAINVSIEEDVDCLRGELPALRDLQDESVGIQVSGFHLRFYREEGGAPRLVATRRVWIDGDSRLRDMPSCFDDLSRGVALTQGFLVDTDWLFDELPATLASQVLDVSQEFVPSGGAPPDRGAVSVEIRPLKDLGVETAAKEDEDHGLLHVAVNTRDLESRYRSQTLHFLGVAAMLVLSLATGLALLLRSVRRDLEAAQRTENFVAAITHELRTPLSAIRMYGEMLRDGWAKDDAKRAEYYRRIVREAERLDTLVEHVLQKSSLSTAEARPAPGDLSRVVEGLAPSLSGADTAHPSEDLAFDLAPALPPVLLVQDGVRSIVANLVENARKYAPVPIGTAGAEPIRVATRVHEGEVVLEVQDRGPGIPQKERERIFQAFYRIGNEATRTARGTGLGLHLVALQSEAMGARVQVLDREGGGTVFRVTFRAADVHSSEVRATEVPAT